MRAEHFFDGLRLAQVSKRLSRMASVLDGDEGEIRPWRRLVEVGCATAA